MCRNNAPGGWGNGSLYFDALGDDAQWIRYERSWPLCYTRTSSLKMRVRMRIGEDSTGTRTLRVTGLNGQISGMKTFDVKCGTRTQTVDITATLPPKVWAYQPLTLTWETREYQDEPWSWLGTTSHNLYVTYGAPFCPVPPCDQPPTQKRMGFLCNAAEGLSSARDVTDAIHARLNADPPIDGDDPEQTDTWELMYGLPYQGECHKQAKFMVRALNLLGITASAYFTYASTDTNVTDKESRTSAQLGINTDQDGDGVAGEERWWLQFDFDGNMSVDNNFEGSVSAAAYYYAVWPSLSAGTKCRLLRQIGPDPDQSTYPNARQRWVRLLPEDDFDYGQPVQYISQPFEGVGYPSCP